jgi:hypothetical protein
VSTEIFELLSAICDIPDAFTNRSHSPIAGRMSKKHVRKIADLARFGCGLRIECGSWANSRTLDGFGAGAGDRGSLDYISRRLKCSRYGEKQSKMRVVSPPAPRNQNVCFGWKSGHSPGPC